MIRIIDAISQIYFGVPRVAGELFRINKFLSTIVLIGFCGIPMLAAAWIDRYAYIHPSVLPLQMLIAGAVQFAIETDPSCTVSVSPRLAEVVQRLTPQQRDFGEEAFQCYAVLMLLTTVVLICWLYKAFKFAFHRFSR